MHLSRPAQLAAKRAMLVEALQRAGKTADPPVASEIVSGPELGYRNRVRLHVAPSGNAGLLARGSHEVVPVAHCLVSSAPVNRGIEWVTNAPRAVLASLREVSVREDLGGGPTLLRLVPRGNMAAATQSWIHETSGHFAVEVAGVTKPTQHQFPLPDGPPLVVREIRSPK
jgi:hypothetical protein